MPAWLQTLQTHPFLTMLIGEGGPGNFLISRWIFLRLLGIVYLIAFVSFWVQAKGLIGSQGILSVQSFLSSVRDHVPGLARFYVAPTVFWISASNVALMIACALGVVFSILLILGIAPVLDLIALWILYLSLVVAGQDFLSFQWDILLLEAGFLSIFFASASLLPGISRETAVPPIGLLLLWFLLFRLNFESGIVKITTGDATWRNFTALHYHYETQPLPHLLSWMAHQLPGWIKMASVFLMYVCELVLPFLIFVPGFRWIACIGLILLQVFIGLTGNYTFFNLLTGALALLLINDGIWKMILPSSIIGLMGMGAGGDALSNVSTGMMMAIIPVAVVSLYLGTSQVIGSFTSGIGLPFADGLERVLLPFRTFNSYGLFRVMTTERDEITIEGSDGKEWKPYVFQWKPGPLDGMPGWVQPHQPRLDWQMWFAALSPYDQNPWFQNLLIRLLQGSKDVGDLFAVNPFPDTPPKSVRAVLSRYHFTTPGERRKTGQWWRAEDARVYSPVLSLQ